MVGVDGGVEERRRGGERRGRREGEERQSSTKIPFLW